jgi:hypothetical protein
VGNYPNKDMLKCAACGHICNRGYSEYPAEGTPFDKIHIVLGTRLASVYCSDPFCQCYTIYAPSSADVELLKEQYWSKKP